MKGGSPKSEVRSPKTGDGRTKSEERRKRSEVGPIRFCHLKSFVGQLMDMADQTVPVQN